MIRSVVNVGYKLKSLDLYLECGHLELRPYMDIRISSDSNCKFSYIPTRVFCRICKVLNA